MQLRSLLAGTCLAVLVLAGCGGDDDDASGSTTTTVDDTTSTSAESTTTETTTTTTEPVASPPDTTGMDDEAQVRAVVQFAQQLVIITADPEDPVLARYLTGSALERVQGVLRQMAAGGFRAEGRRVVDITSVDIVDDRADVRACVHTDGDTLNADGTVAESVEQTIVVRLQLAQENGAWKVESTGDTNSAGETDTCEVGT